LRIPVISASLVLSLVLLSTLTPAQEEFGQQGPAIKVSPPPLVSVMQGKSVTVPLSFHVPNGYHINSNKPKSEFLIPTVLKVEATTDIVIGKTTYPDGHDMSFAFAPDEQLNVYTGDFNVDVLVRPLHSAQPGKYIVRGTLKYQACDNKACYPPKKLPVSFDVKIAKAPVSRGKNPAQSPHVH
jgi:Disulphide bond corrector protein DsbC